MDILTINFNQTKNMAKLTVETVEEHFGNVTCKIDVNFNVNECVYIKKAYVTDMRIPQKQHAKLLNKLKSNEELMRFAYQKSLEYVHTLHNQYGLNINSIFILYADTKYIRSVKRNGRDLSTITEKNEENHEILVCVSFDKIEEEVKLLLRYNYRKGYKIDILKEYKMLTNPYFVGEWMNELLKQLVPLVQEKVHFLLPEL